MPTIKQVTRSQLKGVNGNYTIYTREEADFLGLKYLHYNDAKGRKAIPVGTWTEEAQSYVCLCSLGTRRRPSVEASTGAPRSRRMPPAGQS